MNDVAQSAPPQKLCSHRGDKVKVGPYEVMAGGTQYLRPEDLREADILIPLAVYDRPIPVESGRSYAVFGLPLVDFGGVPENWKELLTGSVIPRLEEGKKILAFCAGSHGRTGCFLASLIALLESARETPDPIQAVRERHCTKAVETLEQAKAIFALRGHGLPRKYRMEFAPKRNHHQPQPSPTGRKE